MIAILLAATASAAELSFGTGLDINDIFITQTNLRLGASQPLMRHVRGRVDTTFSLDFGQADWTRLTKELVNEASVSPDISKRRVGATASLVIEPFRGEVGGLWTSFSFLAGAGIQSTVDDLDALQTDSTDEQAMATRKQVHPAAIHGWTVTVFPSSSVGLGLTFDTITYMETIRATTTEMKGYRSISLDLVIPLGPRDRPSMEGAAR